MHLTTLAQNGEHKVPNREANMRRATKGPLLKTMATPIGVRYRSRAAWLPDLMIQAYI